MKYIEWNLHKFFSFFTYITIIEMDFEKEKKRFGIRCRQIRKQLGYTSHETFAYDRDLDRSQYGKIEAGVFNLTLKLIVRILNALGMTFPEFFNEDYDSIELDA